MLFYIDDILIVSNSKSKFEKTIVELNNEFDMKDLGVAREILGIEITRQRDVKCLCNQNLILSCNHTCKFVDVKTNYMHMTYGLVCYCSCRLTGNAFVCLRHSFVQNLCVRTCRSCDECLKTQRQEAPKRPLALRRSSQY